MKEPVDHILRPRLPWRPADAPAITECGHDAVKVATITREAFFARVKDLGQQRAAILTCMTCSDTAKRWGSWDDDPRLAVQREITWERPYYYSRAIDDRGCLMRDELLALAQLAEQHRDEFLAVLDEIQQRREWNEKKADLQRKAKLQRGTKPPSTVL